MTSNYLCFSVDQIQIGIPLNFIDRVISAVAINYLPNSPQIVHGLFDYYGQFVPVISLRYRLNLREMAITPDQIFVIVDTSVRKLALVADSVEGVKSLLKSDLIDPQNLNKGIEATSVYSTGNGILLIYDAETFLSGEDEILFENVMNLSPKAE